MAGLYKVTDMTAKVLGRGLLLLVCGCGAASQLASVERAGQLRREGKLPEAYAEYATALCADPGSLELSRQYVEIWHELGQPGDPTARLADCELVPGLLPYVEGLAAAAKGDHATADLRLAEAERLLPANHHGEILYRRGLVALKAERAEEARDLLNRAAGLAPERCEIRLALCQSRIELGELTEAVAVLRNMVKISPSARQIQRGRQLLQTAVRAAEAPLPADVEKKLNETLSALDRAELSREKFLEVLVLANEVSHPRALTIAGIAALRFGAEAEGTRLLDEAATLNPLDPDAPRALGVALLAAERPNEAIAPLRKAFERDPLDSGLAADLAKAAQGVGDRETARRAYRRLVALAPTVTENHLWLARMERQLDELPAARRAIEAAYALDRKNIPVLLERAVVNVKLANTAPTEEEREQAAQLARDTVAELLVVAPEHPGAESILGSLDP